MNDHELDDLIRDASPISAGRVAALDLRDAQSELLETIMAQPDTDTVDIDIDIATEVVLDDLPPPTGRRPDRRRRTRFAVLAAAAAVLVAVVAVRLAEDDRDDVVTEPPPEEGTGGIPRLLAAYVAQPFTIANTEGGEDEVGGSDGATGGGGYTAYYGEPVAGDDGLTWMSISTSPGTLDSAGLIGPARDVTVRGHPGRIQSSPASGDYGPSVKLAWEEAPGVVALIAVYNLALDESEVFAMAESLYEASAQEWKDAARVDVTVPLAEVEALVPADAQASVTIEAKGAALYLDADGQVCATAKDGRGQVPPVCADPGSTRASLFKDRIGWPSILFGVLPAGATNVVATRGGADIAAGVGTEPGSPPPAPTVSLAPSADGSQTLYAVAVGPVPDTLTFVDAQGRPVETVALDIEPDL